MTTPELARLKIDSKGRILLPPSLRDEFDLDPGDQVSVKKIKHGLIVLPAKKREMSSQQEYFARLKHTLDTPPVRTRKPGNPTPHRMKDVWKTKL